MQTDDVLILLQDVAEEIIKPRFRTLAAEEIAEKNPGDLVTVADREAEVRITDALLRAYPDALVLGEEASGRPRADGQVPGGGPCVHRRSRGRHQELRPWLARPRGRGGSAVEDVVRSWIWQPQHEIAYVAERGAGAWENGRRLLGRRSGTTCVSPAPGLGRARRGGTAGARPHVGLLRGGLPGPGRGRGRLRALPSQALGPRTGFAL